MSILDLLVVIGFCGHSKPVDPGYRAELNEWPTLPPKLFCKMLFELEAIEDRQFVCKLLNTRKL